MEHKITGNEGTIERTISDTVELEKTLASFGALRAVSTVRKSFLNNSGSMKRKTTV
ncbi:hypothetical protein [Butyrivibrio sp. FCS014]|uniref:hypothetical protein n=1 Tax=Butyrivibrio sp. FCS014 TaxID=1408304 RepID=UPI0004B836D0|nr:hypothetical protein [Butyrivibrio sp. FCS014]